MKSCESMLSIEVDNLRIGNKVKVVFEFVRGNGISVSYYLTIHKKGKISHEEKFKIDVNLCYSPNDNF